MLRPNIGYTPLKNKQTLETSQKIIMVSTTNNITNHQFLTINTIKNGFKNGFWDIPAEKNS